MSLSSEAKKHTKIDEVGWRYFWKPLPKPWWWVFTFWKDRWKDFGVYEPVKPGEPGYDEAPYEMTVIVGHEAMNQALTVAQVAALMEMPK